MEKKVPSSKKTSQTEKRLIWVVHEGLERTRKKKEKNKLQLKCTHTTQNHIVMQHHSIEKT